MTETQPVPGRDGGGVGVGVAAASLLVGRYRLQQVLGGGGMAQVYQARDERLDRPVAVKVFRAEAGVSGTDLREQNEIRLLAGLRHPGLVAVLDAGTDQPGTAGQRSFLVLELVAGMTLAQRIATGPLPAGEVGEIGAQLATALAYVHEHGVVHRDVKPANVLLGPPQPEEAAPVTVKLSDFGIARLLDGTRITMLGMTVGTANYLSPEQATGADLGAPSDIYSLGLVLLECLTGHLAYPGHGVAAAVARLHHPPVIPTNLDPGWAPLLRAMTDTDPTIRPTATDVAATLGELTHGAAAIQETEPLTGLGSLRLLAGAPITTGRRRPRRRWVLIPAATAVGFAGLIAAGSILATPAPPTSPPGITAPPAATAMAAAPTPAPSTPSATSTPAQLGTSPTASTPAQAATPAPGTFTAGAAAQTPAAAPSTSTVQAAAAPTPPPQATPSTSPPEQQATAPSPQTTHAPSPPVQTAAAPTPPPQATPSTSPPEQQATAPSPQTTHAPSPPVQTAAAPTRRTYPTSPSGQASTPPQATPSTSPPEPTATPPTQAAPAPPSGQVSNPPTPAVPTAPSSAAQVPSPTTAQQLPGAAVAPLPTPIFTQRVRP